MGFGGMWGSASPLARPRTSEGCPLGTRDSFVLVSTKDGPGVISGRTRLTDGG